MNSIANYSFWVGFAFLTILDFLAPHYKYIENAVNGVWAKRARQAIPFLVYPVVAYYAYINWSEVKYKPLFWIISAAVSFLLCFIGYTLFNRRLVKTKIKYIWLTAKYGIKLNGRKSFDNPKYYYPDEKAALLSSQQETSLLAYLEDEDSNSGIKCYPVLPNGDIDRDYDSGWGWFWLDKNQIVNKEPRKYNLITNKVS